MLLWESFLKSSISCKEYSSQNAVVPLVNMFGKSWPMLPYIVWMWNLGTTTFQSFSVPGRFLQTVHLKVGKWCGQSLVRFVFLLTTLVRCDFFQSFSSASIWNGHIIRVLYSCAAYSSFNIYMDSRNKFARVLPC